MKIKSTDLIIAGVAGFALWYFFSKADPAKGVKSAWDNAAKNIKKFFDNTEAIAQNIADNTHKTADEVINNTTKAVITWWDRVQAFFTNLGISIRSGVDKINKNIGIGNAPNDALSPSNVTLFGSVKTTADA